MTRVPTLKKALSEACFAGLEVTPVKRTGEVRVTAPDGERVTHNARRKDASRALIALVAKYDRRERKDSR